MSSVGLARSTGRYGSPIGPAILVQNRLGIAIAIIGLVAAVLGLLPPLIELYGDDDPSPPAGVPTMGPADPSVSGAPTQAPPFPPGTVPPAFVGTWVGSINQERVPPYTVTLTLSGGGLGQRVGTTDYVTLGCDGHVLLAESAADRVVLQENIETGKDNCSEQTTIVLTANPDGTVHYHIDAHGLFTTESNGTLRRQS